MAYLGHVKNGVVVLDASVRLTEGALVRVVVLRDQERRSGTPLRNTPYRFDDPFSPAVDESEWEASS